MKYDFWLGLLFVVYGLRKRRPEKTQHPHRPSHSCRLRVHFRNPPKEQAKPRPCLKGETAQSANPGLQRSAMGCMFGLCGIVLEWSIGGLPFSPCHVSFGIKQMTSFNGADPLEEKQEGKSIVPHVSYRDANKKILCWYCRSLQYQVAFVLASKDPIPSRIGSMRRRTSFSFWYRCSLTRRLSGARSTTANFQLTISGILGSWWMNWKKKSSGRRSLNVPMRQTTHHHRQIGQTCQSQETSVPMCSHRISVHVTTTMISGCYSAKVSICSAMLRSTKPI